MCLVGEVHFGLHHVTRLHLPHACLLNAVGPNHCGLRLARHNSIFNINDLSTWISLVDMKYKSDGCVNVQSFQRV